MNTWVKFCAIAAVVLLLFSTLAVFLTRALPSEYLLTIIENLKQNSGYILLGMLAATAVIAFAAEALFRLIIQPLTRIDEEIVLINATNPAHRLTPEGSSKVQNVARAVNRMADRFETLIKGDQEKIDRMMADAEHERNILAAVLAELPQGMIICNQDCDILLYNQRAKFLLESPENQPPQDHEHVDRDGFIGLGRSVFDVLDKNQILHALEEIDTNLDSGGREAIAYIVARTESGILLRIEMAPVLNYEQDLTGFILMIDDITRQTRTAGEVETQLKIFSRGIRASSAGIRTTVEAILDYPKMPPEKLSEFLNIIYNEARSLGSMAVDSDSSPHVVNADWSLTPLSVGALASTIESKVRKVGGLPITMAPPEEDFFIKADTYALNLAVLFILDRLRSLSPLSLILQWGRSNGIAHIDIIFSGPHLTSELLREWEQQRLAVDGKNLPFTLSEVVRRHGAEICTYRSDANDKHSAVRLWLPVCDPTPENDARGVTVLPRSRPEFYDFDLFSTSRTRTRDADCYLRDLTCTVFDTETTGLDPDGGDEILSIAAVRIVNGRLLQQECFEQLVDPGRFIPERSTSIHGISDEMVKGSPPIEQVLLAFRRFVGDTVMLAHNAAFDMRMLQLKEQQSGIRFSNAVLDTLLLSAVVHPAQAEHTLEAIANRLGVVVRGRHTAMGDAMTAANLFLKIIPLLAEKEIFTLGEAMEASRRTHFARITF